MKFVFEYLFLFIVLLGCGASVDEDEGSINDFSTNTYRNRYCGVIYKQSGMTGGSSGYTIDSENGRVKLIATNQAVEEQLQSATQKQRSCVYSNQHLEMGYEGTYLRVESVSDR